MFKRMTNGEKVFHIFNYLLLILLSVTFLIPFLSVIMTSFVSEAEVSMRGSFILIPRKWNLEAYKFLLGKGSLIFNAYKNTLFIVVVGTAVNMFFTITMAYSLSKKELKGRNFILTLVFITILFNGGLVPNYLLVKELGLIDSLWSLIIPTGISTWNMLIMRNFFYSIPKSLEEAAFLDGASFYQVLWKIVIPLSLPAIATISLFYAVAHWNAWFGAVMYINDFDKYPMQNIMRNIVISSNNKAINDEAMQDLIDANRPTSEAIKSATIIVGTLPILCIYPFIQKYFVKGVMVGSIKG